MNISGFYSCSKDTALVPLIMSSVAAGFPSPADDYIEDQLNLNQLLVHHPTATFFVRADGDFLEAGIFKGDILIIDRSLKAINDKMVIAIITDKFVIRRYQQNKHGTFLSTAHEKVKITTDSDIQIWGVVTTVIHFL